MSDDPHATNPGASQTTPSPQDHGVFLNDAIVPETFSDQGFSDMYSGGYEEKRNYGIIIFAIILFVAVFFLIFKFVYKGGSPSPSMPTKKTDTKITLTYWGLWEESAMFDQLIADYKRKHPNITIIYKKIDVKNYRQKLLSRDQSVADRPDIFRFHNTWLPSLRTVASPLPQTVLTNTDYQKMFYPVMQEDLKIGDLYYGIPLTIDGLILIYNDRLFKAAGIERAPITWEDIIDYSTKLTVKDQSGTIFTSGIALGTATNIEHFSDILGWMILQNGGSLKDLTSPEAVGALEQYRSFAELPTNLWDETMPNSLAAFAQEKVAMIFAPSWQIHVLKQINPDLAIKTAPLPIVPGGKPLSLANYWVEGVSRYSPYQTEAWQFLKYLSEKESLTKMYEDVKTRNFGEPYSRVDLAATLVQNEYVGPVIVQAPYMKSMPVIARTFDNGLNDEIITYLTDAVNATLNGVSYQSAFQTADRGVKQVFQKYEIK